MVMVLIYALCGLAWSAKLTRPDELFYFVARILFEKEFHGDGPDWKKAVAKMTWACVPCVSGQIAAWHTLFFGEIGFIFFNTLAAVGIAVLLEGINRRLE